VKEQKKFTFINPAAVNHPARVVARLTASGTQAVTTVRKEGMRYPP